MYVCMCRPEEFYDCEEPQEANETTNGSIGFCETVSSLLSCYHNIYD